MSDGSKKKKKKRFNEENSNSNKLKYRWSAVRCQGGAHDMSQEVKQIESDCLEGRGGGVRGKGVKSAHGNLFRTSLRLD